MQRTPPLPPNVKPDPRNSPRSTLNRSALPRAPGVPSTIQNMPLPPVPSMDKPSSMSQRPSAGVSAAPPPPPPPPPIQMPMANYQNCTSDANQIPRSPALNARGSFSH